MKTNSIGFGQMPFPVWAEVVTVDGVTVGNIGPLDVRELATVASRQFAGTALLFAVERATYMRDDPASAQADDLAEELSGLAVKVQHVGADEVLIDFADLPTAVSDLYTWGYKLASVPGGADPLDVWASLDANDWTVAPAIASTPHVELFVDSHDDCYLHVETRRTTAMLDLIALLLATAASVAWHARHGEPETAIALPSTETVSGLLGEVGQLLVDQRKIEVEDGLITLPFARERWTPSSPLPAPTSIVTYDVDARSWAI